MAQEAEDLVGPPRLSSKEELIHNTIMSQFYGRSVQSSALDVERLRTLLSRQREQGLIPERDFDLLRDILSENRALKAEERFAPNRDSLRIDVPGLPGTHELAIPSIFGAGIRRPSPGSTLTESDKLEAQVRRIINKPYYEVAAFIMHRGPQDDGSLTAGNGVLINPTTILTARHVAMLIDKLPGDFALYVFSAKTEETYTPIPIVSVQYLSKGDDPDLALIRVAPIARAFYPKLSTTAPTIRRGLYEIGCQQFSQFVPTLYTGQVTTVAKPRGFGEVKLTVFGTNLSSFPGLSGSPVYDSSTGELVGIIHGSGAKGSSYTGMGERRLPGPASPDEWDKSTIWTWLVPVSTFAGPVLRLAEKPAGTIARPGASK